MLSEHCGGGVIGVEAGNSSAEKTTTAKGTLMSLSSGTGWSSDEQYENDEARKVISGQRYGCGCDGGGMSFESRIQGVTDLQG